SKDPVRISVPKGGYAPTFELIDGERIAGRATSTTVDFDGAVLRVQRLLVRPFQAQLGGCPSQALAEGLFEQLVVELTRYSDISLMTAIEPGGDSTADQIGT